MLKDDLFHYTILIKMMLNITFYIEHYTELEQVEAEIMGEDVLVSKS